jgi:GH15 family glucan-1,4-alpha-glucosidase
LAEEAVGFLAWVLDAIDRHGHPRVLYDLDGQDPPPEGAFLLCSFWLVDNLAKQGRLEEAMAMFDSLGGRAGPLGLLPEQIDPSTGAFLGNYPQAFSHVGLISSGVNLARATRR